MGIYSSFLFLYWKKYMERNWKSLILYTNELLSTKKIQKLALIHELIGHTHLQGIKESMCFQDFFFLWLLNYIHWVSLHEKVKHKFPQFSFLRSFCFCQLFSYYALMKLTLVLEREFCHRNQTKHINLDKNLTVGFSWLRLLSNICQFYQHFLLSKFIYSSGPWVIVVLIYI